MMLTSPAHHQIVVWHGTLQQGTENHWIQTDVPLNIRGERRLVPHHLAEHHHPWGTRASSSLS